MSEASDAKSDRGQLVMDGDMSSLKISDDGYSSIKRGGKILYPVRNAAGKVYFSRSPNGDKAEGNTKVLVK